MTDRQKENHENKLRLGINCQKQKEAVRPKDYVLLVTKK